MAKQIGGGRMREIAGIISNELQGLGFAFITFEFEGPCMTNYISNAQREDMIKALEETLQRLKAKEDFKTPEAN
jgi:hypothetical protein